MFLSPEEKLVKLRKKYKITQKKLAGEDITRVFLGMIEVGKRGFTKKTGEILCINMNKILKDRGLEDRVNLADLMETKEAQAKKYLLELMDNVDKVSIINSLWGIDQAIFELNTKEKISWNIKIGDILRDGEERLEARKYYKDSLVGNRDVKILQGQILEIVRLNYYLNDFKDTILTANKLKVKILKENNDLTLKILYNYAYAFYKEENYDKALKEFKYLLIRFENNKLEFNIKNMIGVCYEQIGEFAKGVEHYEALKKGRENEEEIIIILANLLSVAIKLKNKPYLSKLYKEIKRSKKKITKLDPIINFELNLLLAKGAKALDRFEESKKHYLQLFSGQNLEFKNISKLKAISELLKVSTKEDYLMVKGLELKYFDLIKKEKNCYIGLEFINYYLKNNNQKDLNDILITLLN